MDIFVGTIVVAGCLFLFLLMLLLLLLLLLLLICVASDVCSTWLFNKQVLLRTKTVAVKMPQHKRKNTSNTVLVDSASFGLVISMAKNTHSSRAAKFAGLQEPQESCTAVAENVVLMHVLDILVAMSVQ